VEKSNFMKLAILSLLIFFSSQILAAPTEESLFCSYTQHSSFFQYGKMKFTNDLYAQIHLISESLAVYLNKGFSLHVNILIIDQEHYHIYLTNQSSRPMPVYQSELKFNSLGEIISISTSAGVQSLELKLIGHTWKGEYWFDNSRFDLECIL